MAGAVDAAGDVLESGGGADPRRRDSMTLSATTTWPEAYSVSSPSTVAMAQFSMTMRSVMEGPFSP